MHEAVLHGFLSEASSPSLYFAWGTFLLNTQLLFLLQNVEAKTGVSVQSCCAENLGARINSLFLRVY